MLLTRIGLFDDHDIVRAGLRYILSEQSDFVVEAEGSNGKEALDAIRHHALDVCLLDVSMPILSGVDVLRQAKAIRPEMKVLILSAYSEQQYGLNMLKAGAAGFLNKTMAPDQLIAAVRTVASGHRYVSPALGEMLAAGLTQDVELPAHLNLSEREFQIFSRLAKGGSVSDIANELCLSAKTVSTYRSRLLTKMGVSSNAELATYAVTHGLA